MEKRITPYEFMMTILNGVAIGSVVVLIPGALLSEIAKALLPYLPQLEYLLLATSMSNSLMAVVCGMVIGYKFGFPPIHFISLGLATHFASGVLVFEEGRIILQGTGDIISMMFTAGLGSLLIFMIGDKLKSFSLLVIPVLMISVVGMIGYAVLPYILQITTFIGVVTEQLLTIQPIVLAIIISILFAFLILSPITTVGVALAISLSGIGSGAANLGITAAAIGYGILGWGVNDIGVSLALILGSPKMALPLIAKNIKTFIPVAATSAVLGLLAGIFEIVGTPMSAGFGISGLIGPINHINLAPGGWSVYNLLVSFMIFIVAPIVLTLLFKYIFMNVIPIISEEDYRLEVEQ